MEKQATDSEWRFGRLIFIHFIVLIWLGSWWFPELGLRAYWDKLDHATFYLLNGILADSANAQLFWAVANHRAFDLVSAFLLGMIYFHWAIGDEQRFSAKRIGLFAFLFLYSLLMLELSKLSLDWIERSSPSNELTPVYLLSELVPQIKAKDSSGQSFPGDHAMVLFLWSGYFFLFTSFRRGLLVLAIAVLFSLPRLVAGAHWLTDNLIGGLSVALLGLAWLSATPLRSAAFRWFKRFGKKLEPTTNKSLMWMRLLSSKLVKH